MRGIATNAFGGCAALIHPTLCREDLRATVRVSDARENRRLQSRHRNDRRNPHRSGLQIRPLQSRRTDQLPGYGPVAPDLPRRYPRPPTANRLRRVAANRLRYFGKPCHRHRRIDSRQPVRYRQCDFRRYGRYRRSSGAPPRSGRSALALRRSPARQCCHLDPSPWPASHRCACRSSGCIARPARPRRTRPRPCRKYAHSHAGPHQCLGCSCARRRRPRWSRCGRSHSRPARQCRQCHPPRRTRCGSQRRRYRPNGRRH